MENYNQVKRKEREMFIDNMIFLMEERGWTQQIVVDKIGSGLKLNTFKAWLYKRSFPQLTFCIRISQIFDKSIHEMSTVKLYKKVS